MIDCLVGTPTIVLVVGIFTPQYHVTKYRIQEVQLHWNDFRGLAFSLVAPNAPRRPLCRINYRKPLQRNTETHTKTKTGRYFWGTLGRLPGLRISKNIYAIIYGYLFLLTYLNKRE